jgi:ankyrin repeat protein
MAADKGQAQVMKKLIRRGANINASATCEGTAGSVVNAAILSGNREAIELLVKSGASLKTITIGEKELDSPLALAAQFSDLAMFEYLMGACADKVPSSEYDKALIAAAGAGKTEVFNKLLAHDHPQECFQKALDKAAEEESWDIVLILLGHCQGLECEDTVQYAAGSIEPQDNVIRAVWSHSNGFLKTDALDTALLLSAVFAKQSTVVLLLDECGANPNAAEEE